METVSNVMVNRQRSPPSPPSPSDTDSNHSDGSDNSSSNRGDLRFETQTMVDHTSTRKFLEQGDFKIEKGIEAFLVAILYPELTEIAAVIKYESLTILAKFGVRDKLKAHFAPKKQGQLVRIQGPWTGQAIDPIDLKGPTAIPMPVEIGKAKDFAPNFEFLAHESFANSSIYGIKPNSNISKKNKQLNGDVPLLEFPPWNYLRRWSSRSFLSLLVPQTITSSSITNLWFKRNPFGPNSSALLANLVTKTRNLRTLDLETTELGDKGTCQFINSITSHRSAPQNLYLNANEIGEKACESIGKYLADSNCRLESLFLSTNLLGDAGMQFLALGIAKNKTLKRLMYASCGLTGKGLSYLASAIVGVDHQLQTLDIGASQTTKAHVQRFSHFDDSSIEALKSLIIHLHYDG